jgi:uncharacterized membrane protein
MRASSIVTLGIITASVLVSIYFCSQLPDQMVSHWNGNFEPDGMMDKATGLTVFPAIIIILGALFLIFPKIDPLKSNIEGFRGDYEYFVILILIFLLFLQTLVILWNMGYQMSLAVFMPLWFSVIFFSAGTLCKRARRNWFVGIRTPWAMSSDAVWTKTNRRGGLIFQIAGIAILAGLVIPDLLFIILISSMIVIGVYVTTYSYREYQKELGSRPNPKKAGPKPQHKKPDSKVKRDKG